MSDQTKLSQLQDMVRLRAMQEQVAQRAAQSAMQAMCQAEQELQSETQTLSSQQLAWQAQLSELQLNVDAIRLQRAQWAATQERVLERERAKDAATKEAEILREKWGAALMQKAGLARVTDRLDRQVTRREEDRTVAAVEDVLLARKARRWTPS